MPSWLRSSGKATFFHSKNEELLLTRSSDKREKISLTKICQVSTPPKSHPNPLLFNGHLQTIWTVLMPDDVPVYYKRKIFDSDNVAYPGHFATDFVVPRYEISRDPEVIDAARKYTLPDGLPPRTGFFTHKELLMMPSRDSRPMLVVLHGLSGGSHEEYLRHVLSSLLADKTWEACVVNSRGCSQTKITSGVLYNARATWDVRQVVKWLRNTFPNRPLFGIGFSLGANVLATYLAEEGENCELKAAVFCANPWNIEVCSLHLQRSLVGLEVYSRAMGSSTRRLFEQHAAELSMNPRVNPEAVRKIIYQHEFDRELQCSTWGYPTEGAYYRDASCIDSIFSIKIPFFAIHAEDDPIATRDAIPYQEFSKTPYGVLMTTSWGGHLGWYDDDGSRWFVKPVCNFLNQMAKEIDLQAPPMIKKQNGSASKYLPQLNMIRDTTPKPGLFDPMCRKLSIVTSGSEDTLCGDSSLTLSDAEELWDQP
ncbi:putative hydrolase, alpha/beta fold family [Xylogone sp. PMI_703]|nr:putative hydrolase, alpha/beta fold family [Xylogone sp. PMI_703]